MHFRFFPPSPFLRRFSAFPLSLRRLVTRTHTQNIHTPPAICIRFSIFTSRTRFILPAMLCPRYYLYFSLYCTLRDLDFPVLFLYTHKQSSRRLAFPHLARVLGLIPLRFRMPWQFLSRCSFSSPALYFCY